MRERLIPLLLLTVAMGTAYRAGGRARDRIVDLGRSVLTRYEQQSVRRMLVGMYAYSDRRPPADDPGGLEALLQDDERGDRRDLRADAWGNPYELEALGGEDYLLRSLGPNGVRDAACDEGVVGASGGGEPEGLLQRLRRPGGLLGRPLTEEELQGPGGSADEPAPPDDDICLLFSIRRR